jgi:hypothetical protein
MGWRVAFADVENVDLLAFHAGAFLRVQVKSSYVDRSQTSRYKFYNQSHLRQAITQDIDIFAFVALDVMRVYFVPVEHVTKPHVSLKVNDFNRDGLEEDTWNSSLELIFKD